MLAFYNDNNFFFWEPQVWLWSTSPYDCSWHLPLIRSRMYSPAEYWSWICLRCQCFDVGQHSHRHWRRWRKWQDCCCWGLRWRFLHLPERGSCNKRGGSNPRFDPLLAGLPQRLDKPVWIATAPLQCLWNATDMKLLKLQSYFNFSDVNTRETTDWIYGRGRQRRTIWDWNLCFSLFLPLLVCVCVLCVWVCVRLHFKVLLCLHMWACVCLCASESQCGDARSDAAWARSVWPLTFYSVAVWLFKSAWMSN